MPRGNVSKITEHFAGQLRLTIPKALALAIGFRKGDRIEFSINKRGYIELVKVNASGGPGIQTKDE